MEDIKRDGVKFGNELLFQFVGEKARNVKLGHGSFVTIDFGRDTTVEVRTRKGVSWSVRGEWHLWVYMCAWRIDQNQKPFVGSNDTQELIREKLREMQGKALISATILNDAFDAKFSFSDGFELHLFSYQVTDHEQWMLFVPERKTFIAGPGTEWSYISSGDTE